MVPPMYVGQLDFGVEAGSFPRIVYTSKRKRSAYVRGGREGGWRSPPSDQSISSPALLIWWAIGEATKLYLQSRASEGTTC